MVRVKFRTESRSWQKYLEGREQLMPAPGPLVGDVVNIPSEYEYNNKFKVNERAWIQEEIPEEDGLQWVLYVEVS